MSACLEIYNSAPVERIALIRAGVKRSRLRTLARALGIPESVLATDLGIEPGSSERLSQAASEHLIGLMSLIGLVEEMIARNTDEEFDAAKWLGTWLDAPLPALGGARPGSYLDMMTGQELIAGLLSMVESGAYA